MGTWSVVGQSQVLAAHAAMLPTGHILYFSGSEYNQVQHNAGEFDHTRLYDCADGSILYVPSPTTDLFCCGHAFMGDGRLLVAGGTENYPLPAPDYHQHHWPGSRDAWIFDVETRTWVRVNQMNQAKPENWLDPRFPGGGGRWYPTLVTLADGNVLAMSGHPSHSDRRHTNNTPEVNTLYGGQWFLKGAFGVEYFPGMPAVTPVQYPRLHVVPGGDVFCVTPLDDTQQSLRYNPYTERWSYVGQPLVEPDYLDPAVAAGHNTTSVLLPLLASEGYRAQVLLCGSKGALRIDLGAPTPAWVPTAARTLVVPLILPTRYNLNAILLPTGDVFVSGGVTGAADGSLPDEPSVRTAELYHPDTDQWESLEPASVVRNYHSVALLLPDGQVWTAGSNHNHDPSGPGNDTRELRIEIYKPWYVIRRRPEIISAPSRSVYGDRLDVVSPQASSISRAAMLRSGSSTHAFNSDQRYVEALFTYSVGDHLLVTAPYDPSIAPPGFYMLFLLDGNGTPSTGSFVQLSLRSTHETNFAVCPAPGIVEVFWVRPDGMVFTNARDPHINSGNWNNPIPIASNPGSADPRSGVAAVCPAPGIVEVFWVRPDGMVFTNARDPNINNGNWNNPIPIAPNPGSADPRSGVAAVCPAPGIVEVFWVRPDGMVFTNARDPHINSGNWNNPIPIASNPGSADPRSGVAAVCPAPGIVEVFWVRPDGMVFTNARDPHINSGNWNNPIPIAPNPGSADPRSGVAAVCPAPGIVEVFWVRPDGMVFTNARDPHINNGNWNNPIPIAPNPGSADPRSGVAAVCPAPGIVEVFWVRPDGMVFTNARDPHINSGNWNNPIPIASNPGSADPRSGVAAVCAAPGIVEVFWVRPDGMVFTNARDPHINSGNWNNPIPIAPNPGSAAIREV